jgi:hypothetical protein
MVACRRGGSTIIEPIHPAKAKSGRPRGITDTWSAADIEKAKQEAERRRAQEEQKRIEQEERIARWAERKWNRSEPVTRHPYLDKKGVEAHGLRIDSKNRLVGRR